MLLKDEIFVKKESILGKGNGVRTARRHERAWHTEGNKSSWMRLESRVQEAAGNKRGRVTE